MKDYSDPNYWLECIRQDFDHEVRRDWLKDVERAKELLKNELSITSNELQTDWIKRATYMRIFQYAMSKLAFGVMEPRVGGVEDSDVDVAEMYQQSINYEFTRPRGLHRKIGRQQIRRFVEDWINYGLGCYNTYFDSYVRTVENFTGSIINEAIDVTGIILDSDVSHFEDINRVSRSWDITEEMLRGKFPNYEGEIATNEDGICSLYEVQFRTYKPLKARIANAEIVKQTGVGKIYWKEAEKDAFKANYAKGVKGTNPNADTKTLNKEAIALWNSMQSDYAAVPMVYSLIFVAEKDGEPGKGDATIVKPQTYIGEDFTYTMIPFLFQPGTPYPVGAAKFVYEDQKEETKLMTLYFQSVERQNNTGGFISIDKIYGESDADKLKQIENVTKKIGYYAPVTGVARADEIFSQLRYNPDTPNLLIGAQQARNNANDFLNTHREMTGQSPGSEASWKLVQGLQQVGSYPLVHMVSSLKNAAASIFLKTAVLIYKFLPEDKRIAISNVEKSTEWRLIQKERLQKYNPLDLDIGIELDIESDQEKMQKKQEALTYFQMGLFGPKRTLKTAGIRNVDEALAEQQDYVMGQRLVAAMKADPQWAQAVMQYVNTKQLQTERQQQ